VFGTILLIAIASWVVSWVLSFGLSRALPAVEYVQTVRGIDVRINHMNNMIHVIVGQLVQIVFSTYAAVCTTLLYLDMRIRKEGLDLELQAQDSQTVTEA
jgi:hypothetical protein